MFTGKKIGIFGIGKEGLSAVRFFHKNNKVFLLDDKKAKEIDSKILLQISSIECKSFFGGAFPNLDLDCVIRSPGVRLDNPYIKKLTKKGVVITSTTAIFFNLCPCPIIGITGTKGKGTTSTLIFELLKTQSQNVYLAGNIGLPTLDILHKLNKKSLVVLELSSFQLADLKKSPHIAVVLMITSEHQDWHKSKKEYVDAKKPIVIYQKPQDYKIVNADFANSLEVGKQGSGKAIFFSTNKKTNGLYLVNKQIVSLLGGKKEIVIKVKEILLPGPHNIQNVMAAVATAKILKIGSKNIKKVLKNFKGLKHRLELVGQKNGIKFYNDSFSTTPETTIAAINSFSSPKIIILGGSSKNSDFSALAAEIVADKSLRAIILIGEEAKRIESNIKKTGKFEGKVIKGLTTMQQIVVQAANSAKKGYVVILSPACASFDMFKNYEDRGDKFTKAVLKIIK